MNARCLVLPILFAALFAFAGCAVPAPEEAPKAEDKAKADEPRAQAGKVKPWSELLIGNWKRIDKHGAAADLSVEFTRAGQAIARTKGRNGLEVEIAGYSLEGNVLRFTPKPIDESLFVSETRELTTVIESLNEEKLIIVWIVRIRYTPRWAEKVARRENVTIESVLARVREERETGVYDRVKEKGK